MHYYRHHIGDHVKDTAHLTLVEEGAYRRLLDLYYLTDGNIPQVTKEVCRRLRAGSEEETKAVETVLNEFFKKGEAGWYHPQCDAEIKGYKAKAERARLNGKLGGRPSKTKKVSSRLQGKTKSKTRSKANQEPITSSTPLTPQGAELFDRFWTCYPKKRAKADAEKAWAKLGPDAAQADRIVDAVEAFKGTSDWLKDGGQYIPYPATWLNGRRWEDDPATQGQSAVASRPGLVALG